LDSFPEVRRQLAAHVTDEWEKMREHRKASVQYGGSMSERGGLEIPEVPLRLGPNAARETYVLQSILKRMVARDVIESIRLWRDWVVTVKLKAVANKFQLSRQPDTQNMKLRFQRWQTLVQKVKDGEMLELNSPRDLEHLSSQRLLEHTYAATAPCLKCRLLCPVIDELQNHLDMMNKSSSWSIVALPELQFHLNGIKNALMEEKYKAQETNNLKARAMQDAVA